MPFHRPERRVHDLAEAGTPVQFLHASNLDHGDIAAFVPLAGAATEWVLLQWAISVR